MGSGYPERCDAKCCREQWEGVMNTNSFFSDLPNHLNGDQYQPLFQDEKAEAPRGERFCKVHEQEVAEPGFEPRPPSSKAPVLPITPKAVSLCAGGAAVANRPHGIRCPERAVPSAQGTGEHSWEE